MKSLAEFTRTTLVGGLLVLLPVYLVALVEIEEALAPAFIVEELDDGRYTVLVPSVPTPAAGSLLIVARDRVHPLDTPLTQAVKVISHWGVGAGVLARGVSVGTGALRGSP